MIETSDWKSLNPPLNRKADIEALSRAIGQSLTLQTAMGRGLEHIEHISKKAARPPLNFELATDRAAKTLARPNLILYTIGTITNGCDAMDNLYERTDFLERLYREYLNAFNMNRRLAKELATAIRGTLVPNSTTKSGRKGSAPGPTSKGRPRRPSGRRLSSARTRRSSSRH